MTPDQLAAAFAEIRACGRIGGSSSFGYEKIPQLKILK
jgi:hypothetical protein